MRRYNISLICSWIIAPASISSPRKRERELYARCASSAPPRESRSCARMRRDAPRRLSLPDASLTIRGTTSGAKNFPRSFARSFVARRCTRNGREAPNSKQKSVKRKWTGRSTDDGFARIKPSRESLSRCRFLSDLSREIVSFEDARIPARRFLFALSDGHTT